MVAVYQAPPCKMSLLNVVVLPALVLLLVLLQGECQLSRLPLAEDPNHPGKCVYQNEAHDVGSEWSVAGQCQRGECSKVQDGSYMITFAGCGKLAVSDGCTLVSDNSLPYPQCCPRPKCN